MKIKWAAVQEYMQMFIDLENLLKREIVMLLQQPQTLCLQHIDIQKAPQLHPPLELKEKRLLCLQFLQ